MTHEQSAHRELQTWQHDMQRRPGLMAGFTRGVQAKINDVIPEKVHQAITATFKWITSALLTGSDFIGPEPRTTGTLAEREEEVETRIGRYTNAATAEGALTGAGGILLGLADMPLWLSIKVKMLADIAALYGHDMSIFSERVYALNILQLTFSSRRHRRRVYAQMERWAEIGPTMQKDGKAFDWRKFQQEYRDYLDIAKLLQLVPGIGAAVGAVVNRKYTEKLGRNAMNAYRMRWFAQAGAGAGTIM